MHEVVAPQDGDFTCRVEGSEECSIDDHLMRLFLKLGGLQIVMTS
jgi:hypothetical protein